MREVTHMCGIFRKRDGQATVEMAILFAGVVATIFLLQSYVTRATAGGLKSNADSIGGQFSTDEGFIQKSHTSGTDMISTTDSCSKQDIGGGAAVPDCTPTTIVAP